MGIPGIISFCKSKTKNKKNITESTTTYGNLFIDANFVIGKILEANPKLNGIYLSACFLQFIDWTLSQFNPGLIYVAFDGSAPLAKKCRSIYSSYTFGSGMRPSEEEFNFSGLRASTKRIPLVFDPFKRVEKESIASGHGIILYIELKLACFFKYRFSHIRDETRRERAYIDSTLCPGEGEVKIFLSLDQMKHCNVKNLIISGDGDCVAMGEALRCHNGNDAEWLSRIYLMYNFTLNMRLLDAIDDMNYIIVLCPIVNVTDTNFIQLNTSLFRTSSMTTVDYGLYMAIFGNDFLPQIFPPKRSKKFGEIWESMNNELAALQQTNTSLKIIHPLEKFIYFSAILSSYTADSENGAERRSISSAKRQHFYQLVYQFFYASFWFSQYYFTRENMHDLWGDYFFIHNYTPVELLDSIRSLLCTTAGQGSGVITILGTKINAALCREMAHDVIGGLGTMKQITTSMNSFAPTSSIVFLSSFCKKNYREISRYSFSSIYKMVWRHIQRNYRDILDYLNENNGAPNYIQTQSNVFHACSNIDIVEKIKNIRFFFSQCIMTNSAESAQLYKNEFIYFVSPTPSTTSSIPLGQPLSARFPLAAESAATFSSWHSMSNTGNFSSLSGQLHQLVLLSEDDYYISVDNENAFQKVQLIYCPFEKAIRPMAEQNQKKRDGYSASASTRLTLDQFPAQILVSSIVSQTIIMEEWMRSRPFIFFFDQDMHIYFLFNRKGSSSSLNLTESGVWRQLAVISSPILQGAFYNRKFKSFESWKEILDQNPQLFTPMTTYPSASRKTFTPENPMSPWPLDAEDKSVCTTLDPGSLGAYYNKTNGFLTMLCGLGSNQQPSRLWSSPWLFSEWKKAYLESFNFSNLILSGEYNFLLCIKTLKVFRIEEIVSEASIVFCFDDIGCIRFITMPNSNYIPVQLT